MVTLIVFFEEKIKNPLVAGIFVLVPIFTWLSYLFFGLDENGPKEVAYNTKFVIIGTLIAWVPYMLTMHFLATRIGVYKAILAGVIVFLILASIYVWIVHAFNII